MHRLVEDWLKKYELVSLPLTHSVESDDADALRLQSEPPTAWFPDARDARAAVSGLLLRMGYWEASHRVSQEVTTPEGSYWHAIAHRMEPDSFNARYWFRKVGKHPIYSPLRDGAQEILNRLQLDEWKMGANWDPDLYIRWCDEARQAQGTAKEQGALAIGDLEWKLLFSWCSERAR